jgi:nitrogen-specific signal transduction histidine kinase
MPKRMKKQVTGNGTDGVAHELINALNIIQPAAQRIQAMLENGEAQNPETLAKIRNYLRMILRNTGRITNLTRRLKLQPEDNLS